MSLKLSTFYHRDGVVICSEYVEQYSTPVGHHHRHDHYNRSLQQQHQGAEVEWLVVGPREDLRQRASDAAAAPAVSLASTPAADDPVTAAAEYSEPPVMARVVKDDYCQDNYVVSQPSYPAVSGFIIIIITSACAHDC